MKQFDDDKFPPVGSLIRGWHNGGWAYGIIIELRQVGEEFHFRCFWSDDGKVDRQFWSPIRFRLGWKSKMHPWEVICLPRSNRKK